MKNIKIYIAILITMSLPNAYSMDNESLKKAVIATYCGSLIAEATLLSPQFQSLVFGNKPVQETTLQVISKYTEGTAIPVYKAHSLWHSLVGSIFTNHGTLFVNDSVDMQDPEIIKCLQSNLALIKAHRDRNIFIAALVIPALVYGTLGISSWAFTKINPDDTSFLGKIKNNINALTQNFTATSLITLLSIYAFIKAQDYYLYQNT